MLRRWLPRPVGVELLVAVCRSEKELTSLWAQHGEHGGHLVMKPLVRSLFSLYDQERKPLKQG